MQRDVEAREANVGGRMRRSGVWGTARAARGRCRLQLQLLELELDD